MKIEFLCSFCILALLIGLIYGQEANTPAPKLVLSEVEQLKLENLKLKAEILGFRRQVATMCQEQALFGEAKRFGEETLKSHGAPKGVTFDAPTLTFHGTEKK